MELCNELSVEFVIPIFFFFFTSRATTSVVLQLESSENFFFSFFHRCAVISNSVAGLSRTYDCNGMEGRYINIVIPGKMTYLTLCEVKVVGKPSENLFPAGDLLSMFCFELLKT